MQVLAGNDPRIVQFLTGPANNYFVSRTLRNLNSEPLY
jgi:hypothetical protein